MTLKTLKTLKSYMIVCFLQKELMNQNMTQSFRLTT